MRSSFGNVANLTKHGNVVRGVAVHNLGRLPPFDKANSTWVGNDASSLPLCSAGDFDDVSDYDLVTDDQLSVSCGCTEFPPFVASSSSSDSTNSSAGLPAPTWPYLLLSAVAAFAHAMMRL